MCMSGKAEVDISDFSHFLHPMLRIMCEKYFEIFIFDAFIILNGICFLEISIFSKWRFTPILNAYQRNGISPSGFTLYYEVMFIIEHLPSCISLNFLKRLQVLSFGLLRGPVDIIAIIMVAENGIYTVGGFKF